MVINSSLEGLFWLIFRVPTAFSVQNAKPLKFGNCASRIAIQQNVATSGRV